jgi:hypothetical protein
MMLLQKPNLDDRMTDDGHVYCDGSTTATATATTTTTTTTDTAYQQQHHTNTNKLSNEKKRTITKQRHFLLCESCFWCASSIYLVSMDWICPVCSSNNNNDNNNKVESIPIQNNEIYKFDYNQRHGVILEFLESVV